jgi:hypothetical protein
LAQNFEKPRLMRQAGLILENLDGFDDLSRKFVMRGVPHTLAMNTSLTPATFDGTTIPPKDRTGWSGDGSPGQGTLREFAIGAVTQHFTKTLNRVPGVDFRLPTPHELDAMEAFQRFLGRSEDPKLDKLKPKLKNVVVRRGLDIFISDAFNKSQSGLFLGGIHLEPAHIEAVAAFLRVLNALENIRASLELKTFVLDARAGDQTEKALLKLALAEQEDVVEVLEPAGLHPGAVEHMRRAMHHTRLASATGGSQRNAYVRQAIQDVHLAKRDLISD